MNARRIFEYALAGLIVVIIGSLAGWYFVLHRQSATTVLQDSARGFSSDVPTASGGFGGAPQSDALAPATTGGTTAPPQLWHVSKTPVAGLSFFASSTKLRYVERATGNVYEVDPTDGSIVRLTNTLIPKIYSAIFAPNGRVYERSLAANGSITTFVGEPATTTATSSASATAHPLLGENLVAGMTQIAVSPSSNEIFYLSATSQGIAGIRAQWDGTKAKTIFTSAIKDWRLMWLPDGRIILTQSAVSGMEGFSYQLGADGSLIPLVAPENGLTVLPRAKGALLWSVADGSSLSVSVKAGSGVSSVQLPIQTIADKCAWTSVQSGTDATSSAIGYCAVPQSPVQGSYLDDWYRGVAHAADAIWKIDARVGNAENIFTTDSSLALDMSDLNVDQSGNYIAFIDRMDDSLWILRIHK